MSNLEEIRQIPWANSSIGNDPHSMIESLQKGLTVDLIATKRADFETCDVSESLPSVVERNHRNRFDFLPVIEPATNRIIGLLEVTPFMRGTVEDGRVEEAMRPLSEDNLIGADASILAFVRDADRHKCRLIVSGHEISGLVSLSDLQHLPVRAALFGVVTYLEIIMADVIRREFKGTDKWLDRLPDGRQQKLHVEISKARGDDDLIEALLFTQFSDKITIILRSPRFSFEKKEFECELKQIQSLRDHLAHANDYASSAQAASETCRTVRSIDKWSRQLLQTVHGGRG
jgi:hypothetical protein